jgi:DNA-binding response OmpR family regulator
MRIQHDTSDPLCVLLLEPDSQGAAQLASLLEEAGFETHVEGTVHSALQTLQHSFFFALVVIADLSDKNCLAALKSLRQRALRSWMIVGAADCDAHACDLIHRQGGDACVALPIDADDLTDRLEAFRLHERPLF